MNPLQKKDIRAGLKIPLVRAAAKIVYEEKRNVMILISGGVGTGKSTIGVKLLHEFSPRMTPDGLEEHTVFNPLDFIKFVKTHKHKGTPLLMDEAGTQVSNREWFSFNNKAVKLICETFRYKGFIVIFTVPKIEFIDKQVRAFFDYHIEAKKIDFRKKQNILTVKTCKYHSYLKKDIFPFFKMRDGRRVKFFRLNMPPKEMMDRYEKISIPFKEGLADDLYKAAEKMKRKQEKEDLANLDWVGLSKKIAGEIELAMKEGKDHPCIKIIRHGVNADRPRVQTGIVGARFELGYGLAQAVKAKITTILNDNGGNFV